MHQFASFDLLLSAPAQLSVIDHPWLIVSYTLTPSLSRSNGLNGYME